MKRSFFMPLQRLGLDIDGTITSPKTFLPYLNSSFNKQLVLEDITQYDLAGLLNVSKDDFINWLKANEERIYSNAFMAEHAHPTLHGWKDDYELVYISARGNHLFETTKEWFTTNDVPYHHIELIGKHNKIESIKRHQVDVFFEDKHDNACAIAEDCNIPVILFNTPYNQGAVPSGVIRMNSWIEAKKWLYHYESGR